MANDARLYSSEEIDVQSPLAKVPRAEEPVPEWRLGELGTKGRNLLLSLCPGVYVGEVAGLSREKLLACRGYGKKTVDAVMALVKACGDGSVWTPHGAFAMHASDFESLSDMLLKNVEFFLPLKDAHITVMKMYLGFLDATETYTLEETGNALGVTRERVRQLGDYVKAVLELSFRSAGFADLCAWAKAFFDARELESTEEGFVNAAADEFGWQKPTPFSLRRVLDELGFKTVVNPKSGLIAWNKDGCYDWIETYRAPTLTDMRREAIKTVLQEAGRGGLTVEEIVRVCQSEYPDANVGEGNVRGCFNNGGNIDDSGTRMIGFSRGKRGGEGTHYSLNTFFLDEETKSVLRKAGEEVREYMEKTGFGIVDVWNVWIRHKDELPAEKQLPKLGFYMMMRDVGAGGLCYKDYPRISYEGMDVCENAYWWELYEYFHYCGHTKAGFAQIMSFFIDCLGIQPSIALSCAFCSMGLERDAEAIGAPYEIKRPSVPSKAPIVLLNTVKKDEDLSFVKPDGKYTIHSDYFDDDGHAINHPTYVKVFMRDLEKTGVGFSSEELSQLTDAGWCKVHLKIPTQLLKKVAEVRQALNYEYWQEKFKFGGELFYVCRLWHQANKAAFDAWATRKAKQAEVEFTPYEIGATVEDD